MTAVYLTRDAANRARLGTSKYHAVREDERPNGLVDRVTACSGLYVGESSGTDPAEVPEKNRCRTAACRSVWEDQS